MTTKRILCSGVTAVGAQTSIAVSNQPPQSKKIFVLSGLVTSATGSAAVKIQGSLDDSRWVDLGSVTLSLGTVEVADKVENEYPYKHLRANVTAISGTGASVTVEVGY